MSGQDTVTSVAQNIEQAILVFENTFDQQERQQAEQFLLSFRESKSPYTVCCHLLTHSQHDSVKMQAASICLSSITREWPSFAPGQGLELRNAILTLLTQNLQSDVVSRQWMHVVAVLFKRAWLGEEGIQHIFITQLDQLIESSNRSLASQGVLFAEAVVGQCQSRRATALGLSWEYHVRCHRDFERKVLGHVFMLLSRLLNDFMSNGEQLSPLLLAKPLLLRHTLTVVSNIMTWEFSGNNNLNNPNYHHNH